MEQEANKPLIIAVIITFVVAFWFGFFVGWLITGRNAESGILRSTGEENTLLPEKENAETGRSSFSTSSNGNTLQGGNQLAGRNARVASVTLDREGWVVIHERREGWPGAILGAAWLPAGSHENVEINLLRGMEAGRQYYAMLHHEMNDGSESHLFDLEKDLPMQDAGGNVITVSFETISSPN